MDNLSKLLKEVLSHKGYTLHDLFQIQDACLMLKKYGLEDKDLLEETKLYIKGIVERGIK